MPVEKAVYFPVLRLKKGERNALIGLSQPVADRIEPRFVLPPPKELGSEAEHIPSSEEYAYFLGKTVGQYWPLRVCYLECRYLFKEFGHENAAEWLPRLFSVARSHHGLPVPLVSIDEAIGVAASALRQSLPSSSKKKFGLKVSFGDLGDDDLKTRITGALASMTVASHETVLFLDFANADLSDPDSIADFLGGAVQTLQELGVWARIVFQGTNYPEKNPAEAGQMVQVPRTEWQAWRRLVSSDPEALKHLAYGDYVADSAKFNFKPCKARPYPHLRYCGDEHWYVSRGSIDIKQNEAMAAVANKILTSDAYAQREFSEADYQIYQIAHKQSGGGGASGWREINTGRHITKVVSDLGKIYGYSIDPRTIEAPSVQENMFFMD